MQTFIYNPSLIGDYNNAIKVCLKTFNVIYSELRSSINDILFDSICPLLSVNELKYVELTEYISNFIKTCCKKDLLSFGLIWLYSFIKYWPVRSSKKICIFFASIHYIIKEFVECVKEQQNTNNNKYKNKCNGDDEEQNKKIKNMLKIIISIIWRVYLPQTKCGSYIMAQKLLKAWKSPEMLFLLRYISNKDRIDITIEFESILQIIKRNRI